MSSETCGNASARNRHLRRAAPEEAVLELRTHQANGFTVLRSHQPHDQQEHQVAPSLIPVLIGLSL
ncbi:MAG: hypothetical protein ACRCYU_24115 [Nocardioides sp.]